MSSSGPPPEEYYKPYTAPPANQASSSDGHQTPVYQPYRPQAAVQGQGQPQPPYPVESGPPADGYHYQPYHPHSQAPSSPGQNQFVHELPAGDFPQNQQPPPQQSQNAPPVINIQEPTPAPSLASESRPTTIVSPTESLGYPPQRVPEPRSDDDDLYDAPPPRPPPGYQHQQNVGSPAVSPIASHDGKDVITQPPQYHQPEGTSVSYSKPQEGKSGAVDYEPSSDQLTDEIGNLLIGEGESSSAAQNQQPPGYHDPQGISLVHQPMKEGKVPAVGAAAAGHDALPGYHEPQGTSLEYQPVHDGKAPAGAASAPHDAPPQYHEPQGSSLEYQPVHEGKAPIGGATTAAHNEPPQYHEPEGTSLNYQPAHDGKAGAVASGGVAGAAAAAAVTSEFSHPYSPSSPSTYAPPSPSQSTEYEVPPPKPPRPTQSAVYEQPPPLPPRPSQQPQNMQLQVFGEDDPSNPVHYTRDPHKLIAYLIPFPKPHHKGKPATGIPDRFLIYTPPPPPLTKPAEGEKETRIHKIQRKWQEEVRAAKTSTAKTASWQGVRSKATKGIDWAMGQTMSSNLEFLNRITHEPRKSRSPSPSNRPPSSGKPVENTSPPGTSAGPRPITPTDADTNSTEAKMGLEEMVLVYPADLPGTQEELRYEFVNSMLRSKSKAQRDAVIATGLLPITFAIDVLATVIWPFGGLLEIDSVWAYSSIRGAKIARSTTKRLNGTSKHGKEDQLKLSFTPSARLNVLQRYLAEKCHERDGKRFPSPGVPPTESEVLEAIGWSPSQSQGETRNWEDEQWEVLDVKEDFKTVMKKGAREWDGWCKEWEKDPKKALKK